MCARAHVHDTRLVCGTIKVLQDWAFNLDLTGIIDIQTHTHTDWGKGHGLHRSRIKFTNPLKQSEILSIEFSGFLIKALQVRTI